MDKEPSRIPAVPPEYISPFSWRGIKRNPGAIPVIFCISFGAVLVADYAVKLALFKQEFGSDSKKRQQSKEEDDNNSQLVGQLTKLYEREIHQLRQELLELSRRQADQLANQTPIQQPQPQLPQRGNVNVVELSQVIEANNLASASYYKKQLEDQRRALLRDHMLKLDGEILKVKNQYRPVLNKVRELESLYDDMNQVSRAERPARLLWLTCQDLLSKLKSGGETPLEKEPSYQVLRELAASNNRIAQKVLDSIPTKALQQGVQSEDSLVGRFTQVQRTCKRVALVGPSGAGLTSYLLSYLQSLVLFDSVEVTEDEVNGRTMVDPSDWSTGDITARVAYCLNKRNLEQAVRYANQLQGQARLVARDWIRDARAHLETRQALSVLSTYAEAIAVDAARQSTRAVVVE